MTDARRRRDDCLRLLGLFLLTRTVLTVVGVVSRQLLEPFHGDSYRWVYSHRLWLDVWGHWDSGWYFSIVRFGYEGVSAAHPDALSLPHAGNYGFFPLYPALVAAVDAIVGNVFVSALLVSNAAFLCASYLLLRWVENASGRETAWRAVKYLHLFPGAFVLSGAFSEAVCLAVMLGCFLAAERGQLLRASLLGFLVPLARPVGVFVAVPLAWEWLRGGAGRGARRIFDPRVLWLASIPAGLLAWMAFNQVRTGDPVAFATVKAAVWEAGLTSPLVNLRAALSSPDVALRLNGIFASVQIVPIAWLIARRRFAWAWLCLLLLLVPIAGGGLNQMPGVLRFASVIFPYYALLGEWTEDPRVDQAVTIALALLQGFLMVFWANGFRVIV